MVSNNHRPLHSIKSAQRNEDTTTTADGAGGGGRKTVSWMEHGLLVDSCCNPAEIARCRRFESVISAEWRAECYTQLRLRLMGR